jgi:hypothetical protein
LAEALENWSIGAGKAYAVQWNDSYGTYSGSGATLSVTAYQSDGTTPLFSSASSGYSNPSIISNCRGTVYLKVAPYSSYTGAGDYAIRYYTLDYGIASAVSLEDGVWTDGASISVLGEVDWYSFEAEAGKAYYVQWNDSYGDGTYSGSNGGTTLSVTGYKSDGATILFYTAQGYSSPLRFSDYSGKVYLKVEGNSYSIGDYAIRYYMPDHGVASAVSLEEGAWTDGASISVYDGVDWYSFEAEAGKADAGQWNDSAGDGTYSESNGGATLYVSAYKSDGTTTLFDRTSYGGYSTPKTISDYSGKVYLKIEGQYYSIGTYAIRYYTVDHGTASAVSLENGVWTEGASISVSGGVDWYTFEAEAGKTYEVQWNDRHGTYSESNGGAILSVTAYKSNGTTTLFSSGSSGYSTPKTISNYSGTVYLKVTVPNSNSNSSYTGDYAIRYYREGTGGGSGGGEEGGETDPTLYYETYTGGWTAGGSGSTLTLSAGSISGGASISNVTTSGGSTFTYSIYAAQWDYVYADGTKIGMIIYYSYPGSLTMRQIYLGQGIVSSPSTTTALEGYGLTADATDMSDDYRYIGTKIN